MATNLENMSSNLKMKRLIALALIIFTTHVTNTIAEGICATEQCEKAEKIPNLPDDVKAFVNQRDGCDYFRSEPWPEGNYPGAKERRSFISNNLKELCTGTDMRLRTLRKKYRHNQVLNELLNGYEEKIELSN